AARRGEAATPGKGGQPPLGPRTSPPFPRGLPFLPDGGRTAVDGRAHVAYGPAPPVPRADSVLLTLAVPPSMAWRKWIVRGLVFIVLAALAAAGLFVHARTNPTAVRRAVLAQLAQRFRQVDVAVQSARMRLLGGILVH